MSLGAITHRWMVVVAVRKRTTDSEGIFSLGSCEAVSYFVVLFTHSAPCGRQAAHRAGMGEALRHLCTHRIEMAVRRVGIDMHSESGSLSLGSSTKWRIFRIFFEMSFRSTAACSAPWVSPGRGAWITCGGDLYVSSDLPPRSSPRILIGSICSVIFSFCPSGGRDNVQRNKFVLLKSSRWESCEPTEPNRNREQDVCKA